MIFITGRNKHAIEDHFDKAYELETELAQRNKSDAPRSGAGGNPSRHHCIYIRQSEALGLGHAVLCAAPVVGDEPFAVMLADDLIECDGAGDAPDGRGGDAPEASTIAVMEVPAGDIGSWGIVETDAPDATDRRIATITRMVEKPTPGSDAVDAGGGRSLRADAAGLPPPADDAAGRGRRDPADRRHRAAAGRGARVAYRFDGRRYDCGRKLGYLEATVDFGLKHPETGAGFARFLDAATPAGRR